MSASVNLAEALPTLNSMALSFNVYPLILKYVKNRRVALGSPRLLAYDLTLFIVHGILLIQATLTLVLKITRRSKYGKIWLWRKQYLLDQTIPYLIPNGQFIIEPLQILGCIFFELLTVVIYIGVRWPDTVVKRPVFHETCMFWLGVAFAPGLIGFWWSGWSSFYALLLIPTHASHSNHGRIARMYQSPILMNTVCIGVPVLISLFFYHHRSFLEHQSCQSGKGIRYLLNTTKSPFWELETERSQYSGQQSTSVWYSATSYCRSWQNSPHVRNYGYWMGDHSDDDNCVLYR